MWSFLNRKASVKGGIRFWKLTCPALMIAGGVTFNYKQHPYTFSLTRLSLSCPDDSGTSNTVLSKKEFSKKIKDKVSVIREKYKNTGCLESKLLVWSVAGRPDTQSIELKLPSSGGDVVGVMAVWLSVLSQQGMVELHSQSDDGRGGKVVSFVAAAPGKSAHDTEEESGSNNVIMT